MDTLSVGSLAWLHELATVTRPERPGRIAGA
jgi:hypothetical protein